MTSVKSNLTEIQEKIINACNRVDRDPAEINIIAVTKYTTVERAKEVIDAGITNLGENRDQEFSRKFESLTDSAMWHFIGSLQTRKVKNVINKVDFIHSLDRISLAEEINKRSSKPISCFIQVNVSGEESKHGLPKEEVISFIKSLAEYPNINVIGLMTMAPNTGDETVIRTCFRCIKRVAIRSSKS